MFFLILTNFLKAIASGYRAFDYVVRRPATLVLLLILCIYGWEIYDMALQVSDKIFELGCGLQHTFDETKGAARYLISVAANFRCRWEHSRAFKLKILTLVTALVALYQFVDWQKAWRDATRQKVKLERNAVCEEAEFRQEKMMPGSSLDTTKDLPKFQSPIWVLEEKTGEWIPQGQCFRLGKHLITARHVVEDLSKFKVLGPMGELELDEDSWRHFDQDISVCLMSDQQWSKVGMTSAKIACCVPQKGEYAMIQAFGRRSVGKVSPHSVFGYVEYDGSTTGGFSGAPYYMGNTVFGMHTGGSLKNIGFDITYLRARIPDESSEEWFERQLSRYNDFEYEQSPFDPDEYQIRVGGAYHLVSGEVVDRLLRHKRGDRRQNQSLEIDYESYNRERKGKSLKGKATPKKSSAPVVEKESLIKETDSFLAKRPEETLPMCPPEVFNRSSEVLNLPPAPQTQTQFSDHTVGASTTTAPWAPVLVPPPNFSHPPPPAYWPQYQNESWATRGPKSMPARQSAPSTSTERSTRTHRGQRGGAKKNGQKETLHDIVASLCQVLSTHIAHGAPTSPQPGTSTSGSTTNSTPQSPSLTGIAHPVIQA